MQQISGLSQSIALALSENGPVLTILLHHWPKLIAVYAFGSQVTGGADANSDLDLAILIPGLADPLQLWEVAAQLEASLSLPVDLLDFRAASTVLQARILRDGVCLMASQPDTGIYESFVLSEKMAFDVSRAGLINDIVKTGQVYGR